MNKKLNGTVLLSAYACCPGRGTEPGNGWSYLRQYASTFERVILVTSAQDHQVVTDKLQELGIDNVTMKVVKMKFKLDRLHYIPVGGIHVHYFLWLRKATALIGSLREKIDFAHHCTFSSLQFGSPLYKLQCPFVFGPVGGGGRTNKIFYPLMSRKGRVIEVIRNGVSYLFYRFNPCFKGTVRNASLIYCVNEETRAAARRWVHPSRHNRIKMMLDTSLDGRFLSERFIRQDGDGRLRALWTGRLLPRKGLEILLHSVKLLKGENFQLTIVGDGPLREKVLAFIRDNGLEGMVKYAGWVDHRQILDYYRAADIMPFLSYRDSTGQQITEALSQGLPVISFDQFGAALLLNKEVGIKIPLKDDLAALQSTIADTIRALIRDPEKVRTMSRNAAAYARRFTWEHKIQTILKEMEPFLQEITPTIHENADLRLERV